MNHRSRTHHAVLFASLALAAVVVTAPTARAQAQRGKLGGGAGFAVLKNPEISHGRTAVVGGFIGYRFSDSVSFEGGFRFTRSNRTFDQNSEPVDRTGRLPTFRFETNRYNLDGSFVYHIGRRQPFHPFILGGGGLVRRDEKRTDLEFTLNEETGQIIDTVTEVTLDAVEYEPAFHFGAGVDIYFLYNLSARAEFRLSLPTTIDKRTRVWLFGATYYF